MKMFKTAMAGAVAMALMSFGANAATGQGTVTFTGSVIDAPCSIASESADQSIDFGQISLSHLNGGGVSEAQPLKIRLLNCDVTGLTNKKVTVAFSGLLSGAANPTELPTTGGTGTAVVVNGYGSDVQFDGTATGGITIADGSNTLNFSSWVKKATGGTLAEGEFTAVTNFMLAYN